MEVWKDVIGYEGFYQISDLGRVKRLETIVDGRQGFKFTVQEKILALEVCTTGYKRVTLCKNGKTKRFLVHRLVAEMFINNENKLKQVNHKDGNKGNNKLQNLEWASQSNNQKHAYKTGLQKIQRGEARKNVAILKWEQIYQIREMSNSGKTSYEISDLFNINRRHINKIVSNEAWIDSSYTPPKKRTINGLKYQQFAKAVKVLYDHGACKALIAKTLGIPFQVVTNILTSPSYQKWYE